MPNAFCLSLSSDAKPLKNILVIAPAWVGDMIMAQTLFKFLRQRYPSLRLDVLAPSSTYALISRMPEVDQALRLDIGHGELKLRERWQIGRQLKSQHYDQAIVLPNSFKSAIVPFVAGISQRTGWGREGRSLLLTDSRKLDKNALPQMIQRFVALGQEKNQKEALSLEALWPQLKWDPDNTQQVVTKLKLASDKPILMLCPGAEYGPAKRWLPEYYAHVAKIKIEEGWQVWILGGPKDQPIAAEIQMYAHQQCVDLTGKTSLLDAIDLMHLSRIVLTNDSGLMHIAAALSRPLVVIYGSSSPQFTPPLAKHVKILSLGLSCSPCFERVCPLGHFKCMRDLTPDYVIEALNSIEK